MRLPSSFLFLAIHLAACALGVWMLRDASRAWQVLDLLYGGRAQVLIAAMATSVFLAAVQVWLTARRWRRGEPEPDMALRLRVLVYFALACLVIGVFVLFSKFFLPEASLVIAYGVYSLWSLSLPTLRKFTPRRVRRGLEGLCLMATLLLILGELGLRVARAVSNLRILTTISAAEPRNIATQRLRPGTLRFGFPANASGFFDTEFIPRDQNESEYVVASIGDSFSVGVVPLASHFTAVCERELSEIDVYSLGVSNIGLHGYFHLLEHEALPLGPDLVVINLFLGNDLVDSASAQYIPAWYDRNRYLLSVVLRRVRALMREQQGDWPGTEELEAEHLWLTDPLLEKPTFSREMFMGIEVQRAEAACGADEGIYQRFFQVFDELVAATGNPSLAFMLIPDEFQVEDDLWAEVVRVAGKPLDRDKPQRKIGQFLSERGYSVLDLLPLMRAVEPLRDGRQHLYKLQDTHFNVRGNELAGRALASFLHSILDLEGDAPPIDSLELAPTPQELSRPRELLSLEEAVEITQSYGKVLEGLGRDDGRVLSTSRLPTDKDRIEAALMTMLGEFEDPGDREFMRAAVLKLAYFQEAVGDDGADLDDAGPDALPWRVRVDGEVRALAGKLSGAGG